MKCTALIIVMGLLLIQGAQASTFERLEVARAIPPLQSTVFVETQSAPEGDSLSFFLPNETTQDLDLVAIEQRDPLTHRLLRFRHRATLSGIESWTDWMSASLYPGSTSWSGTVRSRQILHDPAVLARMQSHLASLPRSSREPFEVSDFDLAGLPPGEYGWNYDPAKWKPWAGFLWDFQTGVLFRGYRKPDSPGEFMTPSAGLTSSNPDDVWNYYQSADGRFPSAQFTGDNSHWLSPMDKWGNWASRRFGQTWWSADEWEATHHFTNVPWGGYCNGAVNASILLKKPQHSFVDQGIEFDTRDMVGILQAALYETDFLMWGNRYDGPGNDISDPKPSLVVQVAHEYLGVQHVPIAMDKEAGEKIGNVVVLGTRLVIESTADPLVRHGTLYMKDYSTWTDDLVARNEDATVANVPADGENVEVYGFRIFLNEDGTLKDTQWDEITVHPDFLWLPIRESTSAGRNPFLQLDFVHELLSKSL